MKKAIFSGTGFTLIELILVIGIILSLLSLAWLSAHPIVSKTYLSNGIDLLISDIKRQQLKAMTGYTEGRGSHDHYGIYFENNRYVLFHGSVYSGVDSANMSIPFENNVVAHVVSLPSSQIVFAGVSGEVLNYSQTLHAVTLRNLSNNEEKTITINRYGVITAVD